MTVLSLLINVPEDKINEAMGARDIYSLCG